MTYVKTSIDDFNDNSLDTTTVWELSGAATETSQQLHIQVTTNFPWVRTRKYHNMTNSIFAVQWHPGSGTATSSCRFGITATDSNGNDVYCVSEILTTNWAFGTNGAATVSGTTSGTGAGTALPDGGWFGLGMLGSDNILHSYKSSDGVTWTQLGQCTVGGTYDKTKVKYRIQPGFFTASENATWQCNIDEAAIFANFHKTHVMVGGVWVEASVKARQAGAWVLAKPHVRVGGAWLDSH
jgi:hypothetical protein